MAGFIAVVALGLRAAVIATYWVAAPNAIKLERLYGPIVDGSIQTGAAVFWCWVTMALGGRWRGESGWVDRLGRLIGVAWITFALLFAYVYSTSNTM
jgi:hypothetical protein